MKDKIEKVRESFYAALRGAKNADDFADVKTVFLGKKGKLADLLRQLGWLNDSARILYTKKVNALKAEIEAALDVASREFAEVESE